MSVAAHGGLVWGANGDRTLRLDFSANLWPEAGLRLPVRLRRQLEPYPDPACGALEAAACRYYGVPANRLVAVNGSTEGLYLAMHCLRPRTLALCEPTFSEYAAAARWARPAVRIVRSTQLQPAASGLAVLCNPNNPTGELAGPAAVRAWLRANHRAGATALVDEAFLDFVPQPERHSLLGELARWPHLIVLRSLTKRFGVGGLRLGFVFGAPAFIAQLRAQRIPWSVNTLAQQLGTALLSRKPDPDFAARIAGERVYLAGQLGRLGFSVLPAAANFVLARMPGGVSNQPLLARLRRQGIGLRDASNFHGLDASCIRCAVRPRAEMRQLVRALEACL